MAGALLAALPTLLIYIFLGRYFAWLAGRITERLIRSHFSLGPREGKERPLRPGRDVHRLTQSQVRAAHRARLAAMFTRVFF